MTTNPDIQARARRGMTLIELTVSLAILALMVLAFGQILKSSQKVVTGGEGVMKSSAAAAAIIAQIREDFACQSPDSFLAIVAPVDDSLITDSKPVLTFTTVKPADSHYANVQANASLVWYGAVPQLAKYNNGTPMLARGAWLLNGMQDNPIYVPTGFPTDVLVDGNTNTGHTLASLSQMLREDVDDLPEYGTIAGINTFPTLASGTDRLWEVLCEDLRAISVHWCKLDAAGKVYVDSKNHSWFGYRAERSKDNKRWKVAWTTVDEKDLATLDTLNNGKNDVEMKFPVAAAAGDAYMAFWDRDSGAGQWPASIRITMELGVEGAESPEIYEVICPVRRPLR